MLLLLKALGFLRRLGWRDYALAGFVAAAGALAFLFYHEHTQLATARTVYLHPQTRSVEKTVTVTGPVQIRTVVVERAGEKITTTEENRGEVVSSQGKEAESQPVPLSIAMAAPRTDRWLFGAQVDDDHFGDVRAYTALAGYSFRNRVDLLVGGGNDGLKLQAIARF